MCELGTLYPVVVLHAVGNISGYYQTSPICYGEWIWCTIVFSFNIIA